MTTGGAARFEALFVSSDALFVLLAPRLTRLPGLGYVGQLMRILNNIPRQMNAHVSYLFQRLVA